MFFMSSGILSENLAVFTGRVILLHHKDSLVPTDLSGVVYIDITKGINSARVQILKELNQILNLPPWVAP